MGTPLSSLPQATDSMQLNIKTVIAHANRAARTYNSAAALQKEVGRRVLQRMDFIRVQPKSIVDLGCGTAWITPLIRKRYPKAKLINIDIANKMLAEAKKVSGWLNKPSLICAQAENLPLPDQSIDILFANHVLEYCELKKVFSEIKRVLRPGGLFMFATLGPDTLKELRACWQQIDTDYHIHPFWDMHDIGDQLVQYRFSDPVLDIEYFTLTYPSVKQLLQEIKNTGASNAHKDSLAGLTGKSKFQQLFLAYEQLKNQEGRYPATYEVIYGQAWQPFVHNVPSDNNEISIPVSSIKKR